MLAQDHWWDWFFYRLLEWVMDVLLPQAHAMYVRLQLWEVAHLDDAFNAEPLKLHDHP